MEYTIECLLVCSCSYLHVCIITGLVPAFKIDMEKLAGDQARA